MTPSPQPVAFLGFDAAEPSLLELGLADGSLPTLSKMMEEGQSVLLSPVPSGFHNTSWIATVTGTDVGDHQAVLDRQLESGSYRIVDARASTIRRPPFWRYISDAGLRSTVVSIYSAPLLPDFHGTQVQGWGAIDPYSAKFGDRGFDPPEVEQLLDSVVGTRQELYRTVPPRTGPEYRNYCDRILRSVEEQSRGLAALLEQTNWDFFFGSFGESHHAGHLLWHLSDATHPAYDPSLTEDLRDSMMTIYRAIDREIGNLVERMPPETRVFVLTPHGMRPNYVNDPAPTILERSGWLKPRTSDSGGSVRGRLLVSAWQAGRKVVPTRVRLAARSRLADDGLLASMPLAHVDWSQTRAFALPSDMTSYIRLNLAGREPQGIVQPGAEYDQACDDLTRLFASLTHPSTGAAAVDRVVRCAEVFGHPVEGPVPDLCVVWADDQQLTSLRSPELGTVELPFDDPRTGQHRHVGLMVGIGPGIPASGERQLGGPAGNLHDISATALSLLGVGPVEGLQGRPLQAFTGQNG